jgi:hypothetical protein
MPLQPTPNLLCGGIGIVDGVVVPDYPDKVLANGRANDVPVVFGSTAQVQVAVFAPSCSDCRSDLCGSARRRSIWRR